jgi:3-oxoacid CoA-transferase subunit A
LGNLQYAFTAMNFNPVMATAAAVTIAEVEEIVAIGEMNPMHIHTPGIYVQRVVHGKTYEKRIESRTLMPRLAEKGA